MAHLAQPNKVSFISDPALIKNKLDTSALFLGRQNEFLGFKIKNLNRGMDSEPSNTSGAQAKYEKKLNISTISFCLF